MSGAQTSGFPNVLFNAPAAYQAAQQYQTNQLTQQAKQQDITDHDIAAVGQAAAPLLNMSPEDAAAAYPGWLQDMQSRGLAKYAPPTYPGHAATAALVQRAMPLIDQYKMGLMTSPGTQSILDRVFGTGGPTPSAAGSPAGGGPAAAAPATSGTIEPDALNRAQAVRDGLIKRGLDVDTATGFAANALHESGANPNVGAGDAGASHGTFQWNADRYNRYIAINGHPPDNAPLDEQLDFVVHELGTTEGAARDRIAAAQGPAGKAAAISQYYLRPKDVQPEIARRSATATQLATQWGGAGTSTGQPVIAGDSLASQGGLGGTGVVGASPKAVLAAVQADSRAGKYNGQPVVLSTGASNDPTDLASVEQQIREAQGGNAGKITVLGVGPAVEAKAPGTNAKLQALSKAYGADFVPLPADQISPDGVHPTAQGYATLKAAIAPPQGARGGVAARVGGTDVAGPGAGSGGAPGPPPAAPVQPQAQAVPQPPANRVMPGGADGPQAVAAAPVPQQPPPPDQQPPAPTSGLGANSPQYQQGLQYMRQAAAIKAMPGYQYNPQLQAAAAYLEQLGQGAMKLETFRDLGGGMQQNVLTGETKYNGPPTARSTTDNAGNTWILNPGQAPQLLHGNVSGVTGSGPEASALRTINEVGPKIANGTATPQEQANYATAVEVYRQPVLRENTVTKETTRVNTRELPSWAPEPAGRPGGAGGTSGGTGAAGGSNVVIPGYSPQQQEIERDPAKAKVADQQYERNSKEIGSINDSVREAQANNIRVQEMRNILDNVSTGPGTGSRAQIAAWLQRWAPASLSGWTRDYGNLDGAAAVEAFTKLGLTGAGQQERSVLGNRGGYRAIEMFKAANPNVDLLNPANSSILATQLISNQGNIDYAQAASKHFAEQEQRYGDTHKYTSLEQFDQQWNAQRNPQVYAAAMGAISGQPPEQWSKGLSDAEYNRALDIISRADPSAVVNARDGRRISMQPNTAPAPVTVKTPADAATLAPGTPYVTPDGRKFVR